MFYDEHNPPHFHAEFQGKKAVFDFLGNILVGDLGSKTAVKLVREWVDYSGPGICQQRCRIILKKIIRLCPGSESLPG